MAKLAKYEQVWRMNEKKWLRKIVLPVLVANDGNVDKSFVFIKSLYNSKSYDYEGKKLAEQVEPMGINQSLLESAKMRAIKILKDKSKSEQDRIKDSKRSLFSDFQKIGRSSIDLEIIRARSNDCWNEKFIRDFS